MPVPPVLGAPKIKEVWRLNCQDHIHQNFMKYLSFIDEWLNEYKMGDTDELPTASVRDP